MVTDGIFALVGLTARFAWQVESMIGTIRTLRTVIVSKAKSLDWQIGFSIDYACV
jgi:hypothetical protein